MNKKIAYVLGMITLIIGLWGFYDRFAFGHENAAYGSYVSWGLWVALYFLFGGIAVGCFIWASLDLLFEVPALKGTGRIALWAALVDLGVGLLAIGLDLGHFERFYKAFTNPNWTSGVIEDVWGYTIFGILTVLALIFSINQNKSVALKVVMILGLITAIFAAAAPGKMLGMDASRMFWHSSLLPVQFIFLALTNGAAMLLVIRGFFVSPAENEKPFSILSISLVGLLAFNLYFVYLFFSQGLSGRIPDIVQPVNAILNGQYSLLFWGVQIVLGAILPIIILTQRKLAGSGALVGLMGLLVLLGNAVARYLIVVPAQQVEFLPNLSTAFSGRGLNLAYMPSATEWAVASGLLGVVILGMLVGADFILPLVSKSHKEA